MQIVIEMSEEYYKSILWDVQKGIPNQEEKIIASGVPLPKGHGRLIDINALRFSVKEVNTLVVDAPTVLEADVED